MNTIRLSVRYEKDSKLFISLNSWKFSGGYIFKLFSKLLKEY